MVTTIGHFAWNLRGSFSWNDIILTLWGSNILSKPLPNILLYLTKVLKHSRSNGCLSFHHSVIFPWLISCPKLVLKLGIWQFVWVEKTPLWSRKIKYTTRGSFKHSHMSKKASKHSSSNGCLSLWHTSVMFLRLLWWPQLVILLEI